jgi:uncharacterized protein with FMN-binding domain
MNRAAIAAVLFGWAVVLGARPADAEIRTWTDSTGGYKVEAELVDESGGTVRLKRSDGREISLPLERLSSADQAYIRKQRAGAETPTGAADPLAPSSKKVILELLTGAQVSGRITAKDDQSVTVEASVGGRTFTRKYPLERVRAVVVGEQRTVLNESSGGSPPPTTGGSSKPPNSSGTATKRGAGNAGSSQPAGATRSRVEIENLIEEMGRTPPDWWDATPLNYPKTLDLAWPEKPEGNWNNQKNVGQYLWDIIQPNPNKWREGIRFVHFLLEQHQGDRAKSERDMFTLGRLYYLLLQDYGRAAFWWRKAGVERGPNHPEGVYLADCYWRLGSKPMALDYLNRMSRSAVPITAIKQLADMGETRAALQLADAAVRGGYADLGYLYAGDACRIEGQFDQAIRYYDKVLTLELRGNEGEVNRIKRAQTRARTNIEAIRIFDELDLKRIPDGTYRGAAPAYAGELQVEVTVRSGRLEDVKVVRHEEKQYYAAMLETPRKIVQQQGLTGVDATTGATITSEAIINAAAKALGSGMK